ncbi:MAG TPA: exodeoxyribonuclease III, partial [Candidatus Hydrogenedentes bacterium]|nr:exodeoxyribonuclease III [Candidatus Hydrogenedentota bacterium]
MLHGKRENEQHVHRDGLGQRRGLPIVNTYVPQGREIKSEHYAYKLRWFARLREMFAACYSPARPLVWVGDLNVAPTPLDLHDPKSNRNHV